MRRNGISKLTRTGPNDEIREWHRYPFARLFSTDTGDDLRSVGGNRMNRDMLLQFIQKPAPLLRLRFFAGVINAVTQFSNGQSADNDRNGSLRLAMPSSTSRAKSSSTIPHAPPASIAAMIADMVRAGVRAGFIIATGR
jgi:hypothetical protein